MNRRQLVALAGGTGLTLALSSINTIPAVAQRGETRLGDTSERYMRDA